MGLASRVESESLTGRYEALLRASAAIATCRDCRSFEERFANELRHVVAFDYLYFIAFEESANTAQWRFLEAEGRRVDIPGADPAAEEAGNEWVREHQQPLVVADWNRETRFPTFRKVLQGLRIRSTCTVPLTTARRRLGVFGVGRVTPNAYSGEEVRFLSLVADHVALAIDGALSFEALRRAQSELATKNDRLKLVLDLTSRLVSNLDLRDLLRDLSAALRRVMKCDAVGVILPDPENGGLRVYALDSPGGKGFLREETLIPVEGSVPGRVFRTGKPWAGTIRDRPPALSNDPVLAEGHKAGCLMPLVSKSRVLGVLGLGRKEENAFTRDEVEFLAQVASQAAIAVENAIAYRQIGDLKDRLAREKLYLEHEIRSEMNFEEIVGKSSALRRVLKQVETVAPTESTVLILGETGVGKELIARAIHDVSARRAGAFVKLNCAAIPTGLLESELFGHEKGAFTGAVMQRIGRFELANRGTVFLDEIGEVPLELQPKLLRVLQEREFERLGSTRTLRTDARLIAATNHDLAAMVQEQKFRPDLFYRLDVFPIHVPPLRERPEDIPLLVRHYVEQFARRANKTIDSIASDTMNALSRYDWPGNIRELQNVIERAVILSPGPVLLVPLSDLKAAGAAAGPGRLDTLEEAERKHVLAVLEETGWVLAGPKGAALRLGMKRSTLQFRMKKLGLSRPARATASTLTPPR